VDGEEPDIAEELARRRLDHERKSEEVEDLWPGAW
jgi:hypothetical protein